MGKIFRAILGGLFCLTSILIVFSGQVMPRIRGLAPADWSIGELFYHVIAIGVGLALISTDILADVTRRAKDLVMVWRSRK